MSESPKVWFITGASSGFGLALTTALLTKGDDIVVATLRNPALLDPLVSKFPSSRLQVLQLDVTSPSAVIASTFNQAVEKFGRIDVVFNNAGYVLVSELEDTPEDEARRLFDVNFWGMTKVSEAAIKVFRDMNGEGRGGLLIQNCSYAGVVGMASCGWYCASKHAILGYSTSLQSELDPKWNIHVATLITGGFRTNTTTTSIQTLPIHPKYSSIPVIQHVRSAFADHTIASGSVDEAVQVIIKIADIVETSPEHKPLVFALGYDSVKMFGDQLELYREQIDKFQHLMEGTLSRHPSHSGHGHGHRE